MVAEALVGVEAAAWLRAWAGMSMEAKEGLLDNSERRRTASYQTGGGRGVSSQRTSLGSRAARLTLGGEVEERGLLSAVGQLDVGVAQLVEEGVRAGL